MASRSQTTIEDLPRDILRIILKKVPPSTKVSAVLTCPLFRDLIPREERPKLKKAFVGAAKEGHVSLMKLYHKWGAKGVNNNVPMSYAAENGQLEAMKLVKGWGPVDCDWPFSRAVCYGQLGAMKLLKEWGARHLGWWLFEFAAKNGQLEAMTLLKEWGQRDFHFALKKAVKYRQHEAVELLEGWIKREHVLKSDT